jgi:two-component system, NtrC family, response regulator PilR
MSPAVAVVSAGPEHWEKLSAIVSSCGLRPVQCQTIAAARELLAQEHFRLALCEDVLPDGDFRQLIALLRETPAWRMPVIVVSCLDDWGSFLEAMMAGAFDYVAFPPYPHELERALAAAFAGARTGEHMVLKAVA